MNRKLKFTLFNFITTMMILFFITSISFAEEVYEVKELVIPPELKIEGAFFEPSAVAILEDKLIILNDEREEGNMYFYEADLHGNIYDKKLINAGRDIKDFEGITYSKDPGVYYIMLSTSYGRENTKGLFKLSFSDTGYNVTPIPEKVPENVKDVEEFQKEIIYESFKRVFNANELNLEGLAYYKGRYNEFLFFGAREPLINNQTCVWRMNLVSLLEGEIHTPTLWFSFLADAGDMKKHGISSLEFYPDLSSMFITTVYETDEEMGGALWLAKIDNPEDYNVEIPESLLYRWDGVKPEGLTLMEDENGEKFLFIVFDNDEQRTGIPGKFTILPLKEICPALCD